MGRSLGLVECLISLRFRVATRWGRVAPRPLPPATAADPRPTRWSRPSWLLCARSPRCPRRRCTVHPTRSARNSAGAGGGGERRTGREGESRPRGSETAH